MDNGITVEQFWDSTYSEIMALLQSKKKVKRQALKDEIANNYLLAELIYYHVGKFMDSKAKVPNMWDVAPGLFGEEKEHFEKEQKERSMTLYKARMIDFALTHNNRS